MGRMSTNTQNTVSNSMKVVVVVLSLVISISNAEYFSSVDTMQTLGEIEMELLETFWQYLEWQEQELTNYRKFIEQVKLQHEVAFEDVEDYLGNPINAFTLIKRMVIDWSEVHDFVKEGEARKLFRQLLEQHKQATTYPDFNDLRGAVRGLARLQMVYNLSTSDLAIGEIAGVYQSSILTWHESYQIATNLYDEKEYKLALEWFEQTLEKLKGAKDNPAQLKFRLDTYEYMALAQYELGEVDLALSHIDKILELVPNHVAKDTRMYISRNPPSQLHLKTPKLLAAKSYAWSSNYTRLCQGIQLPERVHHRLRCKLETNNNPVFYLAPLKVEEISLDPEVSVFHGLLTNNQIDHIIELAESGMHRSQVVNGTGSIQSDVRVSQQAWVDYTNGTMKQLYRMISAVTNLDLGNAETVQVANYGLGGQYDPHHDFFGNNYTHPSWTGDRIATHMIYLSDVDLGGYTVFPMANVYLAPTKGSMVRWWNLHKSLSPDYRTLHAGCPVIVGSKRIGNIWVHSGMQEFRRSCDLVDDSQKSMGYHY